MALGVLFETCLRGCGVVLMGRHCYVLLRRRHDVPIRCHGDVLLRRLGNVPPTFHWVFHLRRTYDVVRTYRETSLRCHYNVMLLGGANQIIVPDKFEHSVKGFKYFIGYKSDNIIKSLCIILLEMSGFIKYFDNGGKKYVFYD